MYSGTLIEDLMKNVERVEARSQEVQQRPVRMDRNATYAYQSRYADLLFEVA
ncbi:MAG: hypothetical protein M3O85_02010 [Acidobacteriota bacterium]|nr:hypothetical protein [Acidobacteriota bacterium]